MNLKKLIIYKQCFCDSLSSSPVTGDVSKTWLVWSFLNNSVSNILKTKYALLNVIDIVVICVMLLGLKRWFVLSVIIFTHLLLPVWTTFPKTFCHINRKFWYYFILSIHLCTEIFQNTFAKEWIKKKKKNSCNVQRWKLFLT